MIILLNIMQSKKLVLEWDLLLGGIGWFADILNVYTYTEYYTYK